MMLRTFALLGLLAAVPAAAVAQSSPAGAQQAESGKPPQRIRSITLTGNQTCPKSSDPDAEIVVCARVGEPYRIPKDDAGRRAGGLPDTCSPVGSGGQTGCAKMRAEQYAAEKAEAKRQERLIP